MRNEKRCGSTTKTSNSLLPSSLLTLLSVSTDNQLPQVPRGRIRTMPLANHLTLSICHIRVKHIFSSLRFLSITRTTRTLCILPKRHRLVNATAIHFTRPTHTPLVTTSGSAAWGATATHQIQRKPFIDINLRHAPASSRTPRIDSVDPGQRPLSAIRPVYYLVAISK
jgi:hypothetical protein